MVLWPGAYTEAKLVEFGDAHAGTALFPAKERLLADAERAAQLGGGRPLLDVAQAVPNLLAGRAHGPRSRVHQPGEILTYPVDQDWLRSVPSAPHTSYVGGKVADAVKAVRERTAGLSTKAQLAVEAGRGDLSTCD